MSLILYNCEDGKAVELHSSPNDANEHCVDFYTIWYVYTLLKDVQIFQECSLIWGSELPCWGVHAAGRWTLLLGVLRMLHLGFVPRGTKKADSCSM
eukprot:CCRYP_008566-RA/>CCRYP_008566-RA protein AED:0.28 eAED:0.28 QI:4/1/1/1/0/0/2/157/95